jgi:hypothetical protein
MSFVNDDGYVEVIDELTGDTLYIQDGKNDLYRDKAQWFEERKVGDKIILVQKGIPAGKALRTQVPFSETRADIICQLIVEGHTIKSVCSMEDMPQYAVLCSWRRRFPHFDKSIKQARFDRAEHFHDMAIQEAASTRNKDEAPAQKLKVDTYKWAAGVADPDVYGTKTKVSGDAANPISFVVDTGIRRPGDAGYKDVEVASEAVEVVEDEKQLEMAFETAEYNEVETKQGDK